MSASPTYRFYRPDGAGHLHQTDWFEADSDEEAIATVARLHPEGLCEVWKGNQLIGSTRRQDHQRQA